MNASIPEIDLHGYSRFEAKKIIYEKVKEYRKRGIFLIKVIHGYNNGDTIKKWINNSLDLKKELCIRKVEQDVINPGATFLYL
jgi:DNA-nicking Smr family endonuclease